MKHFFLLSAIVLSVISCANPISIKNTTWDEFNEDGVTRSGSYIEFKDSTASYFCVGFEGKITDKHEAKYKISNDTLIFTPLEEYMVIEITPIIKGDTIFAVETGKAVLTKRINNK